MDPKVRFQNRQFNQKLQQARTFKRTARPIPESELKKFLTGVGLGTIFRQILAILILGGAIYLVYIPNFLTWQTIRIDGMSQADEQQTRDAITQAIKDAKFYNPQHNLLFVSKKRLQEVITKIPAVSQINSIHRDFKTHTITISITSKYERFLLRTNDNVLDVYNDGRVKGVAGVDRNYWPAVQNSQMIKLELAGKISNPNNNQILTINSVQYLNDLQKELIGIKGSPLAYIQIPLPEFRQPASPADVIKSEIETKPSTATATANTGLSEPDKSHPEAQLATTTTENTVEVQSPLNTEELDIVLQKGASASQSFRVIIDTKENAHDVVQRLNLLLSQTAPDRYSQLSYIDLRLSNRAFVCLVNTPCSK